MVETGPVTSQQAVTEDVKHRVRTATLCLDVHREETRKSISGAAKCPQKNNVLVNHLRTRAGQNQATRSYLVTQLLVVTSVLSLTVTWRRSHVQPARQRGQVTRVDLFTRTVNSLPWCRRTTHSGVCVCVCVYIPQLCVAHSCCLLSV